MAYSALIRTGWPAERALRLTAEISDGAAQRVFRSIAQRLRDGTTLGAAFKEEAALPREVVHAIEIGEATGASSDALDRVFRASGGQIASNARPSISHSRAIADCRDRRAGRVHHDKPAIQHREPG